MPIEQRVISGGGQKIGSKGSGAIGAKDAPAPEPEKKKGGRRGLLVVVAVVAGVLAVAAYFFVLKPGGGDSAADPEPTPTYEPGSVLVVEPISLNLTDGHYLRLGFSLQLTADVGEETPDSSEAVDLAIALYSGRSVAELSDAATRESLKEQFITELAAAYPGEVMGAYYTNFVTQ
ncbi:MAG TPA: flagellar basal body-associated FliL family protein [Friedmanniella sp.]